MVSLGDLLSIALKIEASGYEFYSNLSRQHSDSLQKFFSDLAEQERQHQEIFRKLIEDDKKKNASLSNWIEEETAGYLKSLADVSIFPNIEKMKTNMTSQDALNFAVGVEKDSIIFYSELIPYIEEEEKQIIKEIIAEEKRHLMDLLSIKL
jgi:rubrerythrin